MIKEPADIYSIWLTPSPEDRAYLANIIQSLSEEYDSPVFAPHCTLYGRVTKPLDILVPIVEAAALGMAGFRVEASRLHYADIIWKTVFIELKMNFPLETLYQRLSTSLSGAFPYRFEPHISLIYKKLKPEVKRSIIRGLTVKDMYEMVRIEIVRTGQRIENWTSVYRINLKNQE